MRTVRTALGTPTVTRFALNPSGYLASPDWWFSAVTGSVALLTAKPAKIVEHWTSVRIPAEISVRIPEVTRHRVSESAVLVTDHRTTDSSVGLNVIGRSATRIVLHADSGKERIGLYPQAGEANREVAVVFPRCAD